MATVYEDMARVSTQITKSTSAEERERLNQELRTLSERLPVRRTRYGEFDVEGAEARRRGLNVRTLYERPARNDAEREAAKLLDDAVIVGAMLKNRNPFETRFWQRMLDENPWLERAMDTATAGDWVPESVSAELHAQVRLQARVASLFRNVPMPTPTYLLPVGGNRPVPYLVSENSGADDDLDTNKRVPAVDVSLGQKLTLTARKVGVRCVPSVELTEDSIVSALPYVREELISAMVAGREDATINGQAAGSHFDSDVTASNDHRKAWNGLRYLATAAGAGNNQAVVAATTPGSVTLPDIRKVRERMDKYAVSPSDCFWLTSVVGYNKLLGLVDSNGNQVVTTVDKFGDRATLVTGSIAALDGFGIVVSEHVRSDLAHSGFYDGITTDSTVVLLVNRREFVFGDYRTATLKSREIISTDQLELVAMSRSDFGAYFPTEPAVGLLYDVRRS